MYRLGYPDGDVSKRWIPCKGTMPLIKWRQGAMSLASARAWYGATDIAENLKGTRFIVIDCDGDHGDGDDDTVKFLSKYKGITHCLEKQGGKSFHLTFIVDFETPTKHCPWCHVDLLGNKNNQIRYYKSKQWNGIRPAKMTAEIWKEINEYIEIRKEDHESL